jgi:CheY-like chemotaxis protein
LGPFCVRAFDFCAKQDYTSGRPRQQEHLGDEYLSGEIKLTSETVSERVHLHPAACPNAGWINVSRQLALVIEDDKDEAIFFAKVLQTIGLETEIIRAGDTALARLAVVVPDLVLLDLHLPRAEGIDILRQIRVDTQLAETHVIVVTGDPQAAESLWGEADLVLIKPIGFDQLRNLAARLISAGSPGE